MKLSTDFLWPLLIYLLIFLLRLNNFSNKILFAFLGFHKWSHTHTFLPHCRVFVHAFLLPPTYGCCCCYSKSLELGFILSTRGATMMIMEIYSFLERVEKLRVSQSPLEESRKRLSLGERDSSKFSALHGKIPRTGNGSCDCIVYGSFHVCVIR